MAEPNASQCGPCGPVGQVKGFLQSENGKTLTECTWRNNPIFLQLLGICSALAVTNRMETTLVMSIALTFCCAFSCVFVSLLRDHTPRRIRMIVQVLIIATFVILVDQYLKAFHWEISKQLGPYVGLIITNCIIMGRCEGFAAMNPPLKSFLDGLGNGLGYSFVLLTIAFFRELLGSGSVFGWVVLPEVWPRCQLMVLAPGAFIMMGVFIWVARAISPLPEEEDDK